MAKHLFFSTLFSVFCILFLLCTSVSAQEEVQEQSNPEIMVVTSPNYDNYTVGELLYVDIYIRDAKFRELNPWLYLYIRKHHRKPALNVAMGRIKAQDLEKTPYPFVLHERYITKEQKDVPYHVRVQWDKPKKGYMYSEDFYMHK
ncbi:hypothetical protein BGZ73_008800 [Actinomortierella ambigua]|nr:hypothetical protein BGZ73_008800 [Actinomortierella ambigua]